MHTLWQDIRYGVRMLMKHRGFTAVAVLTLALGIGANTAIFSVVNAVVLQPLPLPGSDRLVTANTINAEGRRQWTSFPDFQDWREQAKSFEALTAFVPQSVNLTGREEPQRVRSGFVSDNFFKVAGVEPAIGRGFRPGEDDEEGAERVCVVQHDTWQNLFGGDPDFLGSTLVLNNEPFTVVGILPQGFRFPFDEIEVWIPHHHWPVYRGAVNEGWLMNRGTGLVGPIGRLKAGVSLEQAQTELRTIAARLSQQFPESGERTAVIERMREVLVQEVTPVVLVLLGAVGFVLLIACANVANLLLARGAARRVEIAARAALGASRGRLVRQFLTETGLLWVAGCALGLLAGRWGLDALLAISPADLPGGLQPRLDPAVFAYAIGVTGLTGLLFGMIPAVRFSRSQLSETLKEGGRSGAGSGTSRLGSALVVSQVALTVVLLVGAGLLLRSFQRLTDVDVGFRSENLLTMEYRLPQNKYPEGAQQTEFHRQVVERVRAVPGVVATTTIRALPFSGNGLTVTYDLPAAPETAEQKLRARLNRVDPYTLETLGIPLLRGRWVDERDHAGAPPVIVVSQRFARQHWPGEDPVGRRVRIAADPPVTAEIIGVAGDIKQHSLDEADLPYLYVAHAQDPSIFDTLAVRTVGDPMALARDVRAALWLVDPEQPVWKVRTAEFLIERSVGLPRFVMLLMLVYAAMALVLLAVALAACWVPARRAARTDPMTALRYE